LKERALENNETIYVTRDTSQDPTSWLKNVA
jgi:hypothetical protein